MVDQGSLAQALAAAVDRGGPEAAMAVCRACVQWLAMTGAAITMMTDVDGAQEPVCATDEGAARIDELQFSLGDGPCVESFRTGRAVLVADITAPSEMRWPAFSAAVGGIGARGMFVFPLRVGTSTVGVLDCYRDTPGSLSDAELTGALRAADTAVWALLDAPDPRTMPGEADPADVLGAPPAGGGWFEVTALTHAEVHQATGMLMAQAGLDAAGALARLRAAAYAGERPIHDVATDIVARRLRLDPVGVWRTGRAHDPGAGEPGRGQE